MGWIKIEETIGKFTQNSMEMTSRNLGKLRKCNSNFLFSKLWKKFQVLSTESEFQKVVLAISSFDKWSKLASSAELELSDDHLQALCCRNSHTSEHLH